MLYVVDVTAGPQQQAQPIADHHEFLHAGTIFLLCVPPILTHPLLLYSVY